MSILLYLMAGAIFVLFMWRLILMTMPSDFSLKRDWKGILIVLFIAGAFCYADYREKKKTQTKVWHLLFLPIK